MKNFTKLLYVFTTLSLIISCSIKAQEKMLKSGNLNIGNVNYSVDADDKSTLILINTDEIFRIRRNLAVANPGKAVIPSTELKLNVKELTDLKNEILGSNKRITVRFYYSTDEKLMGLAYDITKSNNLTIHQFKKFDKAIRKNFKASFVKSFDYSNYLPYVVRSVILH